MNMTNPCWVRLELEQQLPRTGSRLWIEIYWDEWHEVNEDFLLIVIVRRRSRRRWNWILFLNSGGALIPFFPPCDIISHPLSAQRAEEARENETRFCDLRNKSEREREEYWNGKTNHHRFLSGIQRFSLRSLEIFAIWLFIQTIIIDVVQREGGRSDENPSRMLTERFQIYTMFKVKAHTCRPLVRRLINSLQSAEKTLLFK